MKSKRGQGLPMNTIVIAAIVLVVLVVLIMIFTGRMGGFTRELTKDCVKDFGGVCGPFNCEGKGYKGFAATVAEANDIPEGSIPITGTDCGKRTVNCKYCCIIN